jgi:hypothetical protein
MILIKMNNNYIRNPTLFQIGMLPNTTESRRLQGLQSQQIANNCNSGGCCSNMCNNRCMYPIPSIDVNYCNRKIPKNCPCLRYVNPY